MPDQPTRFIPKLLTVLQEGYTTANLKSDLIAGLTVAIVALPLAMAIGIASEVTPQQGILTAIVAGFFISLLGGSRVQIGGPTGSFVVIIVNVIAMHGYDGLLLSMILAGMILIIAGYSRLGQLIKFIPLPVITGLTTGIAIILATSQIKDFFGLSLEKVPQDFTGKWIAFLSVVDSISLSGLGIGMMALLTIVASTRLNSRLPRYLIALILTSLTVYFLELDVETIGSRFTDLNSNLLSPKWPEFSLNKAQEVLPIAFTIAFLAGVEALLSAVVADGMTGYKHRSNQELVAQGFANAACALFGGIPATGTLSRTATNITVGGKTPFAGIFHSLFLLLFMLLASESMRYIPMPSLGAILIFVAWQMSEIPRVVRTLRFKGTDRVLLLLTLILTVFVDMTTAIAVGVSLASMLFVGQMSRSVEISKGVKDGLGYEREEGYQREDLPEQVEVFTIAGPIFFGIARDLPELLKKVGEVPKVLIIRMRFVPFLDSSGAAALEEVVKQCRKEGIEVIFSALREQPKEIISRIHHRVHWGHVSYAKNYQQALLQAEKMTSECAMQSLTETP